MAPFYRLYQHGYSMESIQKELKNVLDMVTENNKVEGEIFTNFEWAGAFLSVRLISYQKNKEFLSLVPHRRILDLAIIYQLEFEGTDTTMGAGSLQNLGGDRGYFIPDSHRIYDSPFSTVFK